MCVTLNVRHLKCTTESRELAFSGYHPLFYLQDLNTSARCTGRGAYAGNFCANGRLSRPVLPLLDCRPPLLVRVELDGGRMLSTSARTTDACTAPLVTNTGFQTKGKGTTTAGYLCTTSTHKWWGLEILLSRPVLLLLGYRPPILVRVAPERGHMRRASRTRGVCSRTPLLVLGVRGRYVGRLLEA